MATRILFDPRVDLPDGTTGSSPVIVEATPTGIRADGSVFVLPTTLSFTISTAADQILLAAPAASWGWNLAVRRAGAMLYGASQAGSVLARRTVTWTDAASVTWADLTDLDPATLEPTPAASASWTATQELAQAAKDAVDALKAGAPGALDTFLELATQLQADESGAAALAALVGTKAPLVSPALTGTPTVPTVAGSTDSSTKAASTAFVQAVAAALGTAVAATYVTKAVHNLKPSHLGKTRARLAAAVAGTGLARISFWGDSITAGETAAPFAVNSPTVRFRDILAAAGYPIGGTGVVLSHNGQSGQDSRITTTGTGWTTYGQVIDYSQASGATRTFTSDQAGTIAELYYNDTNTGSFQWAVDGGAPQTVTLGATLTNKTATITGLPNTTHTITVTNTAVGYTVLINGFAIRSATGVVVDNWGVGGSNSADWASTAAGGLAAGQAAISTATNPDLIVINIMANDVLGNVGDTTFKTNMQAVITRALTLGTPDVLLVANVPNGVADDTVYRARLYELATTNDLPLLDLQDRWGTATAAAALNLFSAGNLHPNPAGYADMGAAFAGVLNLAAAAVPSPPSFAATVCDASLMADTVMTSSSFVTIPLPTENTDTGNHYDPTTGLYTVPSTGFYMIAARVRVSDGTSAGLNVGFGVHTSIADGPFFQWNVTATSNGGRQAWPYVRMSMFNAGDQLRLYGFFQGGATVSQAAMTIQRIA